MTNTIKYTNSQMLKTIYGFMISNDIEIVEDDYTYNLNDNATDDLDMDIRFLYYELEDYTMEHLFEQDKHAYIDYFGFDYNGIIVAIRNKDNQENDYITLTF